MATAAVEPRRCRLRARRTAEPLPTPAGLVAARSSPRGAQRRATRTSARRSLYLNRELSWLEFNARVLAEAETEAVPLLERLKFHAIVASNLDEFFMVRVAGLKQQLTRRGRASSPPDGLTPHEQLAADLRSASHALVDAAVPPAGTRPRSRRSRESGIVLVKPERARAPTRSRALDERFHNEIFPILTPIAIDPGHPFPHLRNKSLNLGVMFSREGETRAGLRRRAGADDAAAPASRCRA